MTHLILLNGSPPSKEACLKHAREADVILCTDGALNYMAGYGLVPDVIIGDMDSVDPEILSAYEKENAHIERFKPEKDEPDSQLAVDWAIRQKADRIILLGICGGRLDHELANIMLMLYAKKRGVRIDAYSGNQYLTVIKGDYTVTGTPGEIVSVIPLESNIRISLIDGLYYPLDRYPLQTDIPIGISNKLTARTAHIETDGYVLLIHIKHEDQMYEK